MMIRPVFLKLIAFMILCMPNAYAAYYECNVEQKFDSEHVYSHEEISEAQYTVKIKEETAGSFLFRCSYVPSAQKTTCDQYEVDKIAINYRFNTDSYNKEEIKKYYVFHGQFDVQLFPDMSFVENNGRGGVAYGQCKEVSL